MEAAPPVEPSIEACVSYASAHYRVSPRSVMALLNSRGGKVGELRRLPSGDIEVGLARIPATAIEALKRPDYTIRRVADDQCLNIGIAAYLLASKSPAFAMAVVQKEAPPVTPAIRSTAGGARPLQGRAADAARADQCLIGASRRYQIPVPVLQAVLATEGGWEGLRKRNSNGTYDLGVGQINTIHLPELAKYGVTEHALVHDRCTNLLVASYRLRTEINRAGEFWRGVGNYHSRTPHYHAIYMDRIRANLARLGVQQ